MAEALTVVRQGLRRPETALAGAAGLAVVMVLWPLPGFVLDVLLAANLAFALVVLLLGGLAEEPTRLGGLPAALVLSSLARLALCLGVTRTALYDGNPGALVMALGRGLTGDGTTPLTGVAVLGLLLAVSLLVVNVGLMRLAEVAARFALDALPGRQMALEAALSGGRLALDSAQVAGARLDAESAFYGAMDGVARFLRGEAIAVVVIVIVTPLAALAGGTGNALTVSLSLAVGQGLALLAPGLLVGAGAAIAVARGGRRAGWLSEELLARPAALGAVAVVLLAMGLLPGAARVPLLLTAGVTGALAWGMSTTRRRRDAQATAEPPAEMRLLLGLGLLGLLANEDLLGALGRVRTGLSDELGFAVPGWTVADDAGLEPHDYALWRGNEALGTGRLRTGRRLALPAGEGVLPPGGSETVLPDGTPAAWLTAEDEDHAIALGCRLLTPAEVLARHAEEALRRCAAEVYDLQSASDLLATVRLTHPVSVQALEDTGLSLVEVRDTARRLLEEGVGLVERVALVEAMAVAAAQTRGLEARVEVVRRSLSRTITRLVAPGGQAEVVVLATELEEELAQAVARAGGGPIGLFPERAEEWQRWLRALGERYGRGARRAVVLCRGEARRALGQLAREAGAAVWVAGVEELLPTTTLVVSHQISADEVDGVRGSREGVL